VRFVAKRLNDTSYSAKVSEGTNGNLPARNTLVQRLALYGVHKAVRYKQTDRRTDDMMMPICGGVV